VTCEAKRHGTITAYNVDGCKCPDARRARNRDEQQRKYDALHGVSRLINSTGTTRRIHALMAIGWSAADQAQAAGWPHPNFVLNICARQSVRRATARKVAAMYDLLSMTPGPNERTRKYAKRVGYLPPLAWDDETIDDPNALPMTERAVDVDEVAVQRALSGDRTELTREELIAAIFQAHDMGLSDPEIAARLGLKGNTVNTIRLRATRRAS
jgi:hypothetical protein